MIHVASASGLGGDRYLTAYNSAKGTVVNFTRGLAFDLGQCGIRSTPSPRADPEPRRRTAMGESIYQFNRHRALVGYSTPADIGAATVFLASSDARFITGVILPVDGGITAGSGLPDLT